MIRSINNQTWYDLSGASKYLQLSTNSIRLAIERDQLRYTRTSWKTRSKFMFHRLWLDLYLLEHTNNFSWWKIVRIRLANWLLPKVPESK